MSLSSDSPLIDNGVDLGYDSDIYGNPIKGSRDIGPVEYQNITVRTNDHSDIIAYTGDKFHFNVSFNDDNISSASIEYWYKNDNSTNSTITGDQYYSKDITVPSNSTDSLFYIVHSTSSSGDYVATDKRKITVIDNDPPVIVDSSTNRTFTGNDFIFNASITDNIAIEKAYLEYWYENCTRKNISLKGSKNYDMNIVIPDNSTKDLYYRSLAVDGNENWVISEVIRVNVWDDDAPVLEDRTTCEGTTGEQYTFLLTANDNIGVENSYVIYWFGNGTRTNYSMGPSKNSSYEINVPDNSTATLHYYFHVVDRSGNWANTTMKNVSILDNDPPSISDNTGTIANTGDVFRLDITMTDNICCQGVSLEYWFGDEEHNNVSMEGYVNYHYNLTIPTDSTSNLNYLFHGYDVSNNWIKTDKRTVSVSDNDHPSIIDITSKEATTGDDFIIEAIVADNIELEGVFIEYWFGSKDHSNRSIASRDAYREILSIPSNSTTNLYYKISAVDSSNNWFSTSVKEVDVVDNDHPRIYDVSSDKATTGDRFDFTATVVDNIGVVTVYLEYWHGSNFHENVSMLASGCGWCFGINISDDSIEPLQYVIHSSDKKGNWIRTIRKTVNITDDDPPVINDHSPSRGYKGDSFIFNVSANDNIGLSEVILEYWYSDGEHTNSPMKNNDHYYLKIGIPQQSSASLYYKIHVTDSSDNKIESVTKKVELSYLESLLEGMEDISSSNGTTGDSYEFVVNLKDGSRISDISVEYSIGKAPKGNLSMNSNGTSFYLTITLPKRSNKDLYYAFHIEGMHGSYEKTAKGSVQIIDNDSPEIKPKKGKSDKITRSGMILNFRALITDNMGVSFAMIEYWFGDDNHIIEELARNGDNYTISIEEISKDIEQIRYRFMAYDYAGNKALTDIDYYGIEYDYSDIEEASGEVEENDTPLPDRSMESLIEDDETQGMGPHLGAIEITIPAGTILPNMTYNLLVNAYDLNGNSVNKKEITVDWWIEGDIGRIDRQGNFFSTNSGIATVCVSVQYLNSKIEEKVTLNVGTEEKQDENENKDVRDIPLNIFLITITLLLVISAVFIVSYTITKKTKKTIGYRNPPLK